MHRALFTFYYPHILPKSLIKFSFESVDLVTKDSLMVTLSCKANITVNCTFFDESNSIWDSEKKEYLYRNYGLFREIHSVEFDGILKLNVVDGENIDDIDSIEFEFAFDQYTRISQEIVENDSDDDSDNDYYRDQYNEAYGDTYGTIHGDDEGYIEDIKNDKLIDEVFEKISESAEFYKNFIEQRHENWEILVEEICGIDPEESYDIISKMFKNIFSVNISENNDFKIIHEMIKEKLSKIINTYLDLQIDFNEDWKYSTGFNDWLIELKYKDNIFILKSEIDIGVGDGDFYIEHNSKEIERVIFGICLPDFEMTDYGGVKPSSEFSVDLYDIAINELIDKFNQYFEKIKLHYESVDSLYDQLSKLMYE